MTRSFPTDSCCLLPSLCHFKSFCAAKIQYWKQQSTVAKTNTLKCKTEYNAFVCLLYVWLVINNEVSLLLGWGSSLREFGCVCQVAIAMGGACHAAWAWGSDRRLLILLLVSYPCRTKGGGRHCERSSVIVVYMPWRWVPMRRWSAALLSARLSIIRASPVQLPKNWVSFWSEGRCGWGVQCNGCRYWLLYFLQGLGTLYGVGATTNDIRNTGMMKPPNFHGVRRTPRSSWLGTWSAEAMPIFFCKIWFGLCFQRLRLICANAATRTLALRFQIPPTVTIGNFDTILPFSRKTLVSVMP